MPHPPSFPNNREGGLRRARGYFDEPFPERPIEDDIKTFPQDQWVDVAVTSLNPKVFGKVWDLYDFTYGEIGKHVPNPMAFMKKYRMLWLIDVDEDINPDAFIAYKTTPAGNKIALGGTDGGRKAKRALIQKIKSLIRQSGWYAEASHKIADILESAGMRPIDDEQVVRQVLKGREIDWKGKGKYTRTLGTSSINAEKSLYGNPRVACLRTATGTYKVPRVARRQPIDEAEIKRLRKDILALAKAAERPATFSDVEKIVKAANKWRVDFEYMGAAIREELKGRLRESKSSWGDSPKADPSWVQYYLDNTAPFWELENEVMRIPSYEDLLKHFEEPEAKRKRMVEVTMRQQGKSRAEAEKEVDDYFLWKPPPSRAEAEKEAAKRWGEKAGKWSNRIRRKARATWKFLNELAEWSKQVRGGQRSLEVVVPEEENVTIAGFRTVFRGFAESPYQDKLPALKHGLKEYRQLAAKRAPIILKRPIPIFIEWTFEPTTSSSAGAYYLRGKVFVTPWTLGGGKGFVKTMAHEMGHHVYQTFLSGSDKKVWDQFIRGNYTSLDLEYAVKQLKAIGAKTFIDDELAMEDPILFLQLGTLMYSPTYQNSDLFTWEDLEKYMEQRGEKTVRVPTLPISGYAGKNPEEAFCEALGLLVAYGPKAVLGPVRVMLRALLGSGVRTSSHVKAANQWLIEKWDEPVVPLYQTGDGDLYFGTSKVS